MNVRCTGCDKSYRIDAGRVAGRERVRLKCPACETVFEVAVSAVETAAQAAAPTSLAAKAAAAGAPQPRAAPGADTTHAVRQESRLSDSGKMRHGALQLPVEKKVSLAILSGPDQGKIVAIERPRMIIGRADADIVIADPEASRQHAVIEAYGEVFVIRDLSSTNGTFVAEQKITAEEVGNQEEFRIGSSRMMLIVTALDQ